MVALWLAAALLLPLEDACRPVQSQGPTDLGADIHYMKLPQGEILAEARIAEPLSDIRRRLDDDGLVSFDVEVSMRDTEREVAQMTARWRLKRR